MVFGAAVWVWCALMGFGASWLSGFGATGGLGGAAFALILLGGVAVLLLGGFTAGVILDIGWLGGSVDRAGSAVCLVWLILFEVTFFFGAVWCWALLADLQGHGVGLWGDGADAGVGLSLGTLVSFDGMLASSADSSPLGSVR